MEQLFLNADDVARLLRVSKSKAYQVIRQLNQELQKQGKIIVTGRVSTKYFMERVAR